jgi:pSer/pThr/pTyr-binding forkhead associated (FHA) protein
MPTILGRTAGTDTDHMNYIVIPQTTIGRRHALIEYKDYAYWIIDQGSINGTFVNDEMITGETRLKHGDKVRLHKYEFEFVMPEMVDAGMTVISHTVMAKPGVAQASAQTVARAGASDAGEITNASEPEPDFDLSDMATSENPVADRVDTVLTGSESGEGTEDAGDDETIVMDTDGRDTSDTDATLRPDTNDEEDPTVDHFHDNNKTS